MQVSESCEAGGWQIGRTLLQLEAESSSKRSLRNEMTLSLGVTNSLKPVRKHFLSSSCKGSVITWRVLLLPWQGDSSAYPAYFI